MTHLRDDYVELSIDRLRRDEYLFQGKIPTMQLINDIPPSNLYYIKRFSEGWLHLTADTPLDLSKRKRRMKVALHAKLLAKHGFKGYLTLCADLLASLYRTFDGTSSAPSYLPQMADTHVFQEYIAFLREFDTVGYDSPFLLYIVDVMNYGKRVKLDDPSLKANAYEKWLDSERHLQQKVLDVTYVRDLKAFVHALLDPVRTPEPFHVFPHHGPGSTADVGRSWRGKITASFTEVPDKVFRYLNTGAYQSGPFPWILDDIQREEILKHARRLNNEEIHSRARNVPKSANTDRLISMEPAPSMYWQQAVFDYLNDVVKSTRASRYVTLEDQGHSRKLTLQASLDKSMATVDLSSASDTLSWDLVKQVFPPWITAKLAATRTHRVLDDDSNIVVSLRAGPMGNAWTFPVQSIVFTASALLALYYAANQMAEGEDAVISHETATDFIDSVPPNTAEVWHGTSPLSVYGDDIILDDVAVQALFRVLSSLGFIPNIKKSFWGDSDFRESCGMFAARGVDITPIRYTFPLSGEGVNPQAVQASINMANDAFSRGYLRLRSYHIQYVKLAADLRLPVVVPNLGDKVSDDIYSELVETYGARRSWKFRDYSKCYDLPFTTDTDDTTRIHTPKVRRRVGVFVSAHQRSLVPELSQSPSESEGFGTYGEDFRYIEYWRRIYGEGEHTPLTSVDDLISAMNKSDIVTANKGRAGSQFVIKLT